MGTSTNVNTSNYQHQYLATRNILCKNLANNFGSQSLLNETKNIFCKWLCLILRKNLRKTRQFKWKLQLLSCFYCCCRSCCDCREIRSLALISSGVKCFLKGLLLFWNSGSNSCFGGNWDKKIRWKKWRQRILWPGLSETFLFLRAGLIMYGNSENWILKSHKMKAKLKTATVYSGVPKSKVKSKS